jgi:hypothetical protein
MNFYKNFNSFIISHFEILEISGFHLMESDIFKYNIELLPSEGRREKGVSNNTQTPIAYRHFPQGKTQKARYQAIKKRQW